MARLARVIAPGMPYHVTQWGNRRQQTFFGEEDYRIMVAVRGRVPDRWSRWPRRTRASRPSLALQACYIPLAQAHTGKPPFACAQACYIPLAQAHAGQAALRLRFRLVTFRWPRRAPGKPPSP